MLKRFLCVLFVGVLAFTSLSANVSAENFDSANESCIVKDSVSETVLKKDYMRMQKFKNSIL